MRYGTIRIEDGRGHLLSDKRRTYSTRDRNPEGKMSQDHVTPIAKQLPYLRRFSRCLVSDRGLADDLVRDCLVEALARTGEISPDAELRPWLYKILWSCFERSEHHNAGVNVLERLPDEERAVLGLVSLDGIGYKEAAQILRVDVRTVRSRLSHARHALGDVGDSFVPRSAAE